MARMLEMWLSHDVFWTPVRGTIYESRNIMRKYVLNDRSVRLRVFATCNKDANGIRYGFNGV